MRELSYERPDTLARAVTLLRARGRNARLLAGGTDLIVGLRQGSQQPDLLIDVKAIPELSPAIGEEAGVLSISAGTVLTDIADDDNVHRYFPALAEAAGQVGAVQIRNRATLAGNICNASPAADTAPPLLAYRAEVLAWGPAGQRRIPIGEFFAGPGRTTLTGGELVLGVELPVPRQPCGSAFGRLSRRRGADVATVSACACVDAAGVTRFGYGAVGPRPLLVTDDSGVLADPGADRVARAKALARLARLASPISDVRASQDYRASMLLLLSQRVLATAISRRGRQEGNGHV